MLVRQEDEADHPALPREDAQHVRAEGGALRVLPRLEGEAGALGQVEVGAAEDRARVVDVQRGESGDLSRAKLRKRPIVLEIDYKCYKENRN